MSWPSLPRQENDIDKLNARERVARSTRRSNASAARRHEASFDILMPLTSVGYTRTPTAFYDIASSAYTAIMPPGRPRGRPAKNTTHSTANAAAAAPQSRLSFGPKNAANKITKPAATTQSHSPNDKKLSPKQKRAIEDAATSEPAKTHISEPTSPSSPSSDHHDDDEQQPAKPAAAGTTETKAATQQDSRSRSGNKPLPIRASGQADLANASKVGPRDSKEVEATKVSEAQIKKYWKGKEDDRIASRVHQRGLSVHEKVLREFDLSSQFGVGGLFSLLTFFNFCASLAAC